MEGVSAPCLGRGRRVLVAGGVVASDGCDHVRVGSIPDDLQTGGRRGEKSSFLTVYQLVVSRADGTGARCDESVGLLS